jgi:YidC/Oxa1 family membrane protein insertase
MNFKDLLVPITFALVASLGLQYLFFGNKEGADVESSFVAPKERREYKPLNVEVDFFDTKRSAPACVTDIETTWGFLSFSTDGASLESIDFKRESNGSIKTIRTLFPVTDTERENRCFLVGLDEQTPFYYGLVSFNENSDAYRLVYSAENNECIVKKTFVVDKDKTKIDVLLDIVTKKDKQIMITPRIFFPAPFMPEMRDVDIISSIVIDQAGVFAKKSVDRLDVNRGWFAPELFGSDSRYFIYSMIGDTDNFAQRAYYKLENRDRLFSIIEGPAVTSSASWQLSFYCGPKDLTAIAAVDSCLEKTLDYSGIFSLIAKFLLKLINWLYTYLHNYGLAIIAVTLLIQLALLPLTLRNGEEKFKKQQAEYQQRLAIIKHRFKDEPDKLAVEQAELLRTHGMPGLGCLIPLLLQIPIFFALSRVLSSSFELYQAPMLWISDLSAKDPYYILPLIVTFAMLVQDGKVDPQQRMSKIMMACVFGAFTSSFSAGLTLYIAAGRIIGLIQSRLVKYFNLV